MKGTFVPLYRVLGGHGTRVYDIVRMMSQIHRSPRFHPHGPIWRKNAGKWPEDNRPGSGRYCCSSQLVYFESGFGPAVKTMSYLTDQIAFFFYFFLFSDRELSPSRVEMRNDDHEIRGQNWGMFFRACCMPLRPQEYSHAEKVYTR